MVGREARDSQDKQRGAVGVSTLSCSHLKEPTGPWSRPRSSRPSSRILELSEQQSPICLSPKHLVVSTVWGPVLGYMLGSRNEEDAHLSPRTCGPLTTTPGVLTLETTVVITVAISATTATPVTANSAASCRAGW